MEIIPANLSVRNRLCIVVGSGKAATAAAGELVCRGARVRIVAGGFSSDFPSVAGVERVRAAYGKRFLKGARLVVAASSATVNAAIERDARKARIRVIVAAAARTAARASETSRGRDDARARAERLFSDQTLIAALGDEYTHLAHIIAALRPRAVKRISDPKRRAAFFEALVDDAFLETIRRDGCGKALAFAESLLDEAARRTAGSGRPI